MDPSGAEPKLFATPVKNVSQEKFKSLREKVGRESPYLYRTKQLSDVTKKPSRDTRGSVLELGSDSAPKTEKRGTQEPTSVESGPVAFAFENKALSQYSRRIVNKELETRRIISNLVALLLWNLGVKFLTLFLHHTAHGINIQRTLIKWAQELVIYRLYPHADLEYSLWSRTATIANISHVFHLIIFFNVTVSLWRLVLKSQNVKIDDLHLNNRQKQLLGVSEPSTSSKLPMQASQAKQSHIGSETQSSIPLQLDNVNLAKRNPSPVYLFKSLQTPLKSRQQESLLFTGVRSAHVKKVNAFGDLNTSSLKRASLTPPQTTSNAFMTPKNRNGFIPSSKYAYMRDSPSPRKTL
ncbi:LAME_0C03070g1_1 [Lachancea meyersii CBS 8951]|uniref:LAME_0C03070g1_1 n=1 Tax=Lachancea meyersii CBS 8951 TaxID=1266667 RepID=A0A1G4J093_9SACH|nr:LAME_0C03070g1_1 [Lachancea meyersii CBS 8951]